MPLDSSVCVQRLWVSPDVQRMWVSPDVLSKPAHFLVYASAVFMVLAVSRSYREFQTCKLHLRIYLEGCRRNCENSIRAGGYSGVWAQLIDRSTNKRSTYNISLSLQICFSKELTPMHGGCMQWQKWGSLAAMHASHLEIFYGRCNIARNSITIFPIVAP